MLEWLALSISLLAFLVAIIGHEIMHGFVALFYGDDTAKLAGRLTINPIKHIDLLGSIILPLGLFLLNAPFLFGWAKPVPINVREVIKNGGYNGIIAVSLAGIAYNIALAIFALVILYVIASLPMPLNLTLFVFKYVFLAFLFHLVIYNLILAVFNLLPIPPLDGSQALGYLSLKFGNDKIPLFFNKIEPYGIFILMAILISPLAQYILLPIEFVLQLLGG